MDVVTVPLPQRRSCKVVKCPLKCAKFPSNLGHFYGGTSFVPLARFWQICVIKIWWPSTAFSRKHSVAAAIVVVAVVGVVISKVNRVRRPDRTQVPPGGLLLSMGGPFVVRATKHRTGMLICCIVMSRGPLYDVWSDYKMRHKCVFVAQHVTEHTEEGSFQWNPRDGYLALNAVLIAESILIVDLWA